MKRRDQRKKNY